jgi:dethiobiotin synthetase
VKNGQIVFVSGIDTGIGKTIATGLIARGLQEAGRKVITQKGVQTGCTGQSEDIVEHRRLMGTSLLPEDEEGLTCQYLFATPCSPHLAARLAGVEIQPERITSAAQQLAKRYEVVLVEGAGGLFVPLTDSSTIIDYLGMTGWPILIVSSCRLGSINHTLAVLEAIHTRKLKLAGVVYNTHETTDPRIAEDTLTVISRALDRYDFRGPLLKMEHAAKYDVPGSCKGFAAFCPE